MKRVVAIGELLIDFIPNEKGIPLKDVTSFTKKPGGAPANVCVQAKKCGVESAFIGMVGDDTFGHYLKDVLYQYGVDTNMLLFTKEAKTALAFVSLDSKGERDFMFYRDPSADQLLDPKDVKKAWFTSEDILHFCSVSLCDYPIKDAHHQALHFAIDQKAMVCFDPNLRHSLWKDHVAYRKRIIEFLPYADILKISDDELFFITQIESEEKAIKALFNKKTKIIIITRGKDGASLYTKKDVYHAKGFTVDVKDTTGAGDSFIGAFLAKMAQHTPTENEQHVYFPKYLEFACSAAALTTTAYGAMDAMPNLDQIIDYVKK